MKLFGLEIKRAQAKSQKAQLSTYTTNNIGVFTYSPHMTVSDMLANGTVNACVGIISDAVAGLPLNLYRVKGEGRERDKKSSLNTLFHIKVNFYQKPFIFKKQIMLHLLLRGNAYIFIERSGGVIVGLYALNPEWVEIKKTDGKNEYYYLYHVNGLTYKYDADTVLHIPAMQWNGVYGLSPIECASRAPQLGNKLDRYTGTVFDGGIHSKLMVTVPETERNFSKEDAEKLSARIQTAYGGVENASKPLILANGYKGEPLNLASNTDSQLVENRTYTVKEIAKIFRVPLSMLGESDAKYNNNEQQARNFLQNTLTPWLLLLQEYFNELIPVYDRGKAYFEFDTNTMTRADSSVRVDMYVKELTNGMVTLNDINRMENRPLIDSKIGDVRFMPVNLAPVTPEYVDAYMARQKQTASEGADAQKSAEPD